MENTHLVGKRVYESVMEIIVQSGRDPINGGINYALGYIDRAEFTFIEYPKSLVIYGEKSAIQIIGKSQLELFRFGLDSSGVVHDGCIPDNFHKTLRRFVYKE